MDEYTPMREIRPLSMETVKNKNYALGDANIMGYCIIDYGAQGNQESGKMDETGDAAAEAAQVESYQKWLNTWYSTLLKRYCGSLLDEDGSYGPKTRLASLIVWKDIMNRLYGACLALEGTAFDDACRKAGKYGLVQYGSTGTLTAIAEGILAARGYYRGNIDA